MVAEEGRWNGLGPGSAYQVRVRDLRADYVFVVRCSSCNHSVQFTPEKFVRLLHARNVPLGDVHASEKVAAEWLAGVESRLRCRERGNNDKNRVKAWGIDR